MELKAGFGRQALKLKLPAPTIYSKFEGKLVDKMLDPLHVSVTIWEYGQCRGAFITLDVLCIPNEFTRQLRRELRKQGFNPSAVLVSATHTHSAPVFIDFRGCRQIEGFFHEALSTCLEAVCLAVADMQPTALNVGKNECRLNVNRLQMGRLGCINDINAPGGDIDPGITALIFERKKSDIILVNYAAHSLTISRNPFVISADYPGRLVRAVEKNIKNSHCLFLQGAAADLNIKIHGGEKESEQVGAILAEKVLECRDKVKNIKVNEVKCLVRNIKLPLDIESSLKYAAELRNKEDNSLLFQGDDRKGSLDNENSTREAVFREWADKVMELDRKTERDKFYEVEVQKIAFGDFVIIALPGEPFMKIGRQIKKYGADMVIGYANTGEPGYLPTKKAFEQGEYETDQAYIWYGNLYKYHPDIERVITQECWDLI